MRTLEEIMTKHDVEVPEQLLADAEVPMLDGPQRQGDVIVLPVALARPGKVESPSAVPAEGVAVVRGENGGNTHLLVAEGPVVWAPATGTLDLGTLTVPDGAAAWLLHPEHGTNGIAPGSYVVRRQREQADEIRLVAD